MSTDQTLEQSFHRCLWRKIGRYALHVGRSLITKTLWLYYAAQDPATPGWAKTVIYGALAYFIMPLDAIPDITPVAGFTDDLGALAAAVATVAAYITEDVKAKAEKKIRDWFG